jgi:hypothetical protein
MRDAIAAARRGLHTTSIAALSGPGVVADPTT